MNVDEVTSLLRHMGVDPNTITVDSERGWVRSSCPFARWLHESGSDNTPSFGMSLSNPENPDSRTVGKCFSCMSDIGAKTPPMLVQMLWVLSKTFPRSASKIVSWSADVYDVEFDAPYTSFDSMLEPHEVTNGSDSFNKVLRYFHRLNSVRVRGYRDMVQEYLSFRKVPVPIQRQYDVRYSTLDGVIGFPLTTEYGDICHMRIRKPYSKQIRTLSPWYFKGCADVSDVEYPRITATGALFGLHLIQRGRPIYVVEGEIDAMVWASLGFTNVIASTTTSVTASQFSRIFSLTNVVIFGFDADKAGAIATAKATKEASRAGVIAYGIDWAAAGLKDAGEVSSEEHVTCLKKAIKRLTI